MILRAIGKTTNQRNRQDVTTGRTQRMTEASNESETLINEGLATVAEAARFLSLGRSTIYELMNSGKLRYCKIGGARRIPWRAVRALAAESLSAAG
jgi:excisionase family DNA binding protein